MIVFLGIFMATESLVVLSVTVLFVFSNIDCSPITSFSFINPTLTELFDKTPT